jgi:hypothetical protein
VERKEEGERGKESKGERGERREEGGGKGERKGERGRAIYLRL